MAVEGCIVPGSRVQLLGLAARPELNGTVAVVLKPESEAEEAYLAETERAKVSHFPKALSLKRSSLAQAPAPDWRGQAPFTVLEIAARAPRLADMAEAAAAAGEDLGALGRIGELHSAEDFAETLWCLYGRGSVEPAAALPEGFAELILDTPGHWLYWIGLEQVGHHIIVEACDCTWRVYQAVAPRPRSSEAGGTEATTAGASSQQRPFEEFNGVLLQSLGDGQRQRGYRSCDWVRWVPSQALALAGAPPDVVELDAASEVLEDLPDELAGARARWAGGRELSRDEAAAFLSLIADLKEQAQSLAAGLKAQTPCKSSDDDVAAEWARGRFGACGDFSVVPSRPGSPRSGPGYAEAGQVFLFSPPRLEPPCDLSLPTSPAFSFMKGFAQLVGEYPEGRNFLALLEFLGWASLEREDGGRAGWTLRSRDLRGDAPA